jgi:hypothetical protein
MSLESIANIAEIQDRYFFRLPYAHIIADYVWPGVVMSPKRVIDIRQMEFGPDDIVIASYPKSGTTWMAELVSALAYGGDTAALSKVRQDERVPWLELENDYLWVNLFYRWNRMTGATKAEEEQSPKRRRVCITHLPLELLPPSIIEGKCRLIYVARNPKDNAVSFFHFHKMARFLGLQKNTTWNDFFALYVTGSLYCGSWFEHVTGYWRLAQKNSNVLFCKYEEMKDDLPKQIRRVADYLDFQLDPEQMEKVVEHCTFDSMKNNKMANRDKVWLFDQKISKFMRKGQVGDWKNYFTLAQSAAFDALYEDKMQGIDLSFQYE